MSHKRRPLLDRYAMWAHGVPAEVINGRRACHDPQSHNAHAFSWLCTRGSTHFGLNSGATQLVGLFDGSDDAGCLPDGIRLSTGSPGFVGEMFQTM